MKTRSPNFARGLLKHDTETRQETFSGSIRWKTGRLGHHRRGKYERNAILSHLATGLITRMVFGQAVEAGTIDGTIGFARFGSVSSGATNTASFYNPVQISYASGNYSGVPPLFT